LQDIIINPMFGLRMKFT